MQRARMVLAQAVWLLSLSLIVIFDAHAQTGPKYVVRIFESGGSFEEFQGSDDGVFYTSLSVSGTGWSQTQSLNTTHKNRTFWFYVRTDIAPSTVNLVLIQDGAVRAYRPASAGYVKSRAVNHDSIPVNPWLDGFGPTGFAAMSDDDDLGKEVAISAVIPYTVNVSSTIVEFDEWPDEEYFATSANVPSWLSERRYCDPPPTPPGLLCNLSGFTSSGEINATLAVTASGPYTSKPGKNPGPTEPLQCGADGEADGEKRFWGELNLATGNAYVVHDDPVRTRGFPLRNRIYVNTQAVELTRPMGNATFTYDMHVYSPSMSGQTRWTVVDGDGQRLDFGNGTNPAAGAGIFSTLSTTTNGFLLSGASEPEDVRHAGNFSYEFDSNGKLLSVTDPAGNIQELTYSSGNLTTVTDLSSTKALTFGWTGSRITQVTENGGATTTLTYAGTNSQIATISAQDGTFGTAKSMTFTYDSGTGLLNSFQRGSNPDTKHDIWYTTVNNTNLARTYNKKSPINVTYNLLTPVSGAIIRHIRTNKKGGRTFYDFNSNFDLLRVTDPVVEGTTSGVVKTLGFNSSRLMTSFSDGANTRTFDYETNGLLKKVTRADSTYVQFNWSGADLTSVADSIGTRYTFTYGNSSLPHIPTAVTNATSNTWTFGRNAYGQLTTLTRPSGSPTGVTTYQYEESSGSSYGWLKKIIDPLGNETRFNSFNEFGDPLTISTDPDPSTPSTRLTETRAYDAAQRLRSLVHDDGKSQGFTYTDEFLSSSTDEASTSTSFTYCPSCLALQTVSQPLSHLLSWGRDLDRDLTTFTDARSNVTQYTYGEARELVGTTYPDSSLETQEYDSAFRLKKSVNGRNEQTQFTYDSIGRTDQISFPTTSEPTQTFTYRSDDFPLTVTDEVGTTSYEYYSNRLLKAEVYDYSSSGLTNTQRVDYEYWPDNLLKKITWKNGTTVIGIWTYNYDSAGRMYSVNSFSQTDYFAYDGENKLKTQTNHNNTTINYTWNDARKWPLSITHKRGSTTFGSYAMEYDGTNNTVGNLTKVTDLGGGYITYGYNALYRLTSETRTGADAYSTTYVYDDAGNLSQVNSSTFATYDAANKMATFPAGSSKSYDNDGNLTGVTGAGIPASTFDWDTRSKLTSLQSGGVTRTYKTDARGRRVIEQIGSSKRFFIFAGNRLLGEILDGHVEVAYTWGPDGLVSERLFDVPYLESLMGGGEEFMMMEMSCYPDPCSTPIDRDLTLWYHFGPQGETRYTTDESGYVADSYLYDAYGKPIWSTEYYYNAHRYGGKVGYHSNLNASGLVLAGARWYSPNLRRWISRDPISYQGGENFYRYSKNAPTTYFDHSGTNDAAIAAATGASVSEIAPIIGPILEYLANPAPPALVAGAAIAGGGAVMCAISAEACEYALYSCGAIKELAPAQRKDDKGCNMPILPEVPRNGVTSAWCYRIWEDNTRACGRLNGHSRQCIDDCQRIVVKWRKSCDVAAKKG